MRRQGDLAWHGGSPGSCALAPLTFVYSFPGEWWGVVLTRGTPGTPASAHPAPHTRGWHTMDRLILDITATQMVIDTPGLAAQGTHWHEQPHHVCSLQPSV